jgi:CubicO group peptidase (beta-lactamase class C family)
MGNTPRMTGFPPAPDSLITLANWQDSPNHCWAFQHVRELVPTQRIGRGPGPVSPLPAALWPVGEVTVTRLDGSASTVDEVIRDTFTDAFLMLHHGSIVDERYFGEMTAATPHLVMSVSKSIVGCVASVLIENGVLDPNALVTDYVAEVSASGYAGATVRHLLDMRTGVAFREAYTAMDAEVRVMERSMGWRPPLPGDPVGAYAYLTTLGTAGPHGDAFTYRSADTDMLGWVCERASGFRMADLVSDHIWAPLGAEADAEISCDAVGTAVHDGGISAVARDLARFGQMLLDDGRARGRQIVPASWLQDSLTLDPDVRDAFARSDNEPYLPGGWYRNQFWIVRGFGGDLLVCLGIHGQMICVDRGNGTVGVKLSSWPHAQNAAYLIDTLRAFSALSTHLASAVRPNESLLAQ